MLSCGVLALQGDWAAHQDRLQSLGAESCAVRSAADLDRVQALVIPGGESSAMLKLMQREDLGPRIAERVALGMPVLATCAGVILLADGVSPDQPSLGVLRVDVERNAYGRQVHSTIGNVALASELGEPDRMEGVFIRAPRITRCGGEVEVLGTWNGDPVLVRQNTIVAATFHPELTADSRVHEFFLTSKEAVHG